MSSGTNSIVKKASISINNNSDYNNNVVSILSMLKCWAEHIFMIFVSKIY